MPEKFSKGRRGAAFKNGKVYFFSRTEIVVIQSYPRVRAWRKTPGEGWRPWRPGLPQGLIRIQEPEFAPDAGAKVCPEAGANLGEPREFWEHKRVLRQREFAVAAWEFSKAIPVEVRRAVRAFQESQFELLQAFGTVPYAMQLAASNPALLYALVRNDRFTEAPVSDRLRFARGWILRRQKVLSARLGFPEGAAGSSVPVLGKIPTGDIRVHRMRWLRQMLHEPELHKILHFAPAIDTTIIGFMWDMRELMNPTLLNRLVQNYDREKMRDLRMLGRDVVRMWGLLGRPWPPRKKVCGLNAFAELHDECWRTIRRRVECEGLQVLLPEKLPPGTPYIKLLNSTREIMEEGEEMRHCVASYVPSMTSGKAMIVLYRVLWPERATLRLGMTGDRWHVAELRGYRNRQVSDETLEYVESWLAHVQEPGEAITGAPGEREIDPELCPF